MTENNDDKRKDELVGGKADKPKEELQEGEMSGSVSEILKERMRLEDEQRKLDKMIKDKFQHNITVMFTDIKGSTAYFEAYGDVEGRAMVHKHNEMLFPCVERHGGRVIKTIGDAIMALFQDPAEGVRAAVEIQNTLDQYNQEQDQKHKQIHVRVGLNYGPGVVEEKDVFGDAVNVAARVEGQADADQVIISEDLYKEIRREDDILCRFAKEVAMKGKSEPVKLYRVIWSEEQLVAEGEFKKTGTRRAKDTRERLTKGRVVELHVSRDGNQLKVSVFERARAEEKTVQQYDTIKVSEDKAQKLCDEVVTLLNRANRRGKISKEILKQLQELGQNLYDQLLTPEAKEKLAHSGAEDLILRLDDQLVHIPWELLYDGSRFLCQRFAMGRIVSTRQHVREATSRHIARPLKMMILADPRGDLPASAVEGRRLRDTLDPEHELINANMKLSSIDTSFVKNKLRDYDVIHYAGHADYDAKNPANSGWLLAEGKLTAGEVSNMAGKKPMPALVVANGCQSGQTDQWKITSKYEEEIFGIANAFLVSGVQHYIGTFWDILDEPGLEFALAFYRAMLDGNHIGEAVRQARMHLIDKYGEETIVWASYMLYGDPSFNYLAEVKEAEEAERVKPDIPATPPAYPGMTVEGYPMPLRGVTTATMETKVGLSSGMKALIGVIIAAVVLIGGVLLYQGGILGGKGADEYLKAGEMALEQGDLTTALSQFQQAVQARQGTPAEKAQAFMLIGRIYSTRNQNDLALQNYEQAASEDGTNAEAHINLGQMLMKLGRPAQAQTAFRGALAASPGNNIANMLLAEVVNMQKLAIDKERQAVMDQEVQQLVARYKSDRVKMSREPIDEWTSRPMTLTFLDYHTGGKMAMMEGEGKFLELAIIDALNQTGRVKVVEREKIDKIISELNLSSSQLASEETRLRLGRLLSARLIATGSVIRYGNETQASLRLIETETSEVKISVNPILKGTPGTARIAEELKKEIITKVRKAYPLRGIIAEVESDGATVVINIGAKQGVKPGMEMNVLAEKILKVGTKSLVKHEKIAKLEVSQVEQELAYGKIKETTDKVINGMKVQELSEGQDDEGDED